jgi:hypothetical protein
MKELVKIELELDDEKMKNEKAVWYEKKRVHIFVE